MIRLTANLMLSESKNVRILIRDSFYSCDLMVMKLCTVIWVEFLMQGVLKKGVHKKYNSDIFITLIRSLIISLYPVAL